MTRKQIDTERLSGRVVQDLRRYDALTVTEVIERVHRLARAGHGDHAIAAMTGFGVGDVRRSLAQRLPP